MKKFLALGGVFVAILLMGAGCDLETTTPEAATVQENQEKLVTAVPIPKLNNSLERTNISKRLSTFDDPNKVSYIYLVDYGRVMAFYTIKGKVTSGSKRLTRQTVTVDGNGSVADVGRNVYDSSGAYAVEQPELDGTYGSSASYIFFWTTEGAYVQWSGDYMLVDQPLKLSSQPELIREIK